ncbi:MAG: hypothetical protein OXU51_05940 [Candidatus Poribacteria bacterium]|nr:hypothetical protein [Candidatus Poribacteria bacterium]
MKIVKPLFFLVLGVVGTLLIMKGISKPEQKPPAPVVPIQKPPAPVVPTQTELPANSIAIKIKASPLQDPLEFEGDIKEVLYRLCELKVEENSELSVVSDNSFPDWMLYLIMNQDNNATGISITLTHDDTFMLNHLKVIQKKKGQIEPFIDEVIEMIPKVIQHKMKNKDEPIISTDKSTIFKSQNKDIGIQFGVDPANSIAIKIKTSPLQDPLEFEGDIKEVLYRLCELKVEENSELSVVSGDLYYSSAKWKLYLIMNQDDNAIGISITLTHDDTFVLNHLKFIDITLTDYDTFVLNDLEVIEIKGKMQIEPFIDEVIKMILKVISEKMKNEYAPIIGTDKSTIVK